MCVADNKNAHNFAWLDEKFAEINLSTTPQGDGGANKEGQGNDSQAPHRFICQTLIENYFWKQLPVLLAEYSPRALWVNM